MTAEVLPPLKLWRGWQISAPRGGFGPKFFSPISAQDFHLRFEHVHARGDAFIFFRGPGDRSIDRALADQALEFFVNAQPQHFFPTAGSVSFPKLKQDDVEQGLETLPAVGK